MEGRKEGKKSSNQSVYPVFFSGQFQLFIQLWATGSTYNTATKMKGRKLDSPRHDQQSTAKAHTYVDDSDIRNHGEDPPEK